ncbi:hypothetical protein [Phenylobacterium sp.]|jgi:hypothetical protein|uniref:hypothetical protein n=1 Tax=Phenylobacterium sp. TaxID=1871053 RepID=UPI002F411D3C
MAGQQDPEVRFGATLAAVGRAIRAAPAVFLVAWAARLALEAVSLLLRQEPVRLAYGDAISRWTVLVGLGTIVVSGLLIRWLLRPGRQALRLDLGLLVYGLLIGLTRLTLVGEATLLRLDRVTTTPVSQLLARTLLVQGGLAFLYLVFATLALWPISVLMDKPLSPVRAVRLMAPAWLTWVLTVIVLALPGLVSAQAGWLLHHQFHRTLADRLVDITLGSLTGTLSVFVLAQIYARRADGTDLPAARRAQPAVAAAG